jgi:hypothetical protein
MSKLMAVWDDLLATRSTRNWADYSSQPLPSELDDAIGRLVAAYRGASSEDRQELRTARRSAAWFPVLVYAERMATLALRERAVNRIEDGLIALAIEDFTFDPRDSIPLLALHHHAAGRIGADVRTVFESAAQHASPKVAETLRRFPSRNERDKSLAAMGYAESPDPDAMLAYERTSL